MYEKRIWKVRPRTDHEAVALCVAEKLSFHKQSDALPETHTMGAYDVVVFRSHAGYGIRPQAVKAISALALPLSTHFTTSVKFCFSG